jgi:hypothetical protein
MDRKQAARVEQSVLTLFDALQKPWQMEIEPYRAILGWAARRGWDRSVGSMAAAMVIAHAMIYADNPLEQSIEGPMSNLDRFTVADLKRHLRTRYDMTPEDYRAKWGLPHDYPMVAPNYAKARSDLAKKMGLGTARPRSGRQRPDRNGSDMSD